MCGGDIKKYDFDHFFPPKTPTCKKKCKNKTRASDARKKKFKFKKGKKKTTQSTRKKPKESRGLNFE